MNKSETVKARIEPGLKTQGEAILAEIGLSATDAITMFFRQVVMHGGLPFDAKIPNQETLEAIREVRDPEKRKKLSSYTDVDAMRKDIFADADTDT